MRKPMNGELSDPAMLRTVICPGRTKQLMEKCPDGELSVVRIE